MGWLWQPLAGDSAQSVDVPVGPVKVVGVAATGLKQQAVGVGLVKVSANAVALNMAGQIGVGLVEVVGVASGASKSAVVGVGLVEVVGIAPGSAKSAEIGVTESCVDTNVSSDAYYSDGAINNGVPAVKVGNDGGFDAQAYFLFIGTGMSPGDTITHARVTLIRSGAGTAISVVWKGHDADFATLPGDESAFLAAARTTASASQNIPAGDDQEPLVSPNLASVLQEILDRPGFNALNHIGIIIDKGSPDWGQTNFAATEHATLHEATLHACKRTDIALIEVVANAIASSLTATVGVGLVEVAANAPTSSKSHLVGVGLVEVAANEVSLVASVSVGVGLVEVAANEVQSGVVAEVDPGRVEVAASLAATAKSASLDVGLVEAVGLETATAKSASIGVGLVEVVGVEPVADFGVDAHIFVGLPGIGCSAVGDVDLFEMFSADADSCRGFDGLPSIR